MKRLLIEEIEKLDEPGIEYLYESLGQIVEYAPVHMRVKSEFTEAVEAFMSLSDKFARTPEATEVRKNISKLYYEIYEALVKAWCIKMNLPTDDENVVKYFRLNLERGIAHLCGTGFIKSLDDLVKLSVKEKER